MPQTRPPYPAAFRQQLVELVRSDRTPEDLAREFEPSAQAIRNWVVQAGRDAGERTDGLRTGERDEMRRLRRENRRLREERDLLANLHERRGCSPRRHETCRQLRSHRSNRNGGGVATDGVWHPQEAEAGQSS